MLGVVFTEFLDMVEEKFDLDTVDAIIDAAKIENDGSGLEKERKDKRIMLRTSVFCR